MNVTRAIPLSKKLDIEYVPAVVGFELGSRGQYPIVKGVVVFKEDEDKLREEA